MVVLIVRQRAKLYVRMEYVISYLISVAIALHNFNLDKVVMMATKSMVMDVMAHAKYRMGLFVEINSFLRFVPNVGMEQMI